MAASQPTHAHSALQVDVEYRDIAGYPGYRVGSDGTIWTCRKCAGHGERRRSFESDTWRRLSLGKGNNGYLIVGLTALGKRRTLHVSAIVLEAFAGPRPCGMHACHFPDPSPLNNSIANLRWDTPSSNNRDKEKQGTHQVGERNPRAKLTAEQVHEIRSHHTCRAIQVELSAKFGVSETLVRLIQQRKCWTHI